MTSLAFKVGDLVKVKGAERPTHKLLTPFVGPYHVTERQGDVYQLQDINTGRFVQRHVGDIRAFDASRTPNVRLLAAQAREQWLIETILDTRTTLGPRGNFREEYLVHWMDTGEDQDEWVPAHTVHGSAPLQAFLEAQQDAADAHE